MRPICSDLDNTFTSHPEIRGEVQVIITGNNWSEWEHVMDNSDNLPVYLNPGKHELMDIVAHKAQVLNKINAQKFFEDQKEQVLLLKTMCPNCRIVLVSEGRTAI